MCSKLLVENFYYLEGCEEFDFGDSNTTITLNGQTALDCFTDDNTQAKAYKGKIILKGDDITRLKDSQFEGYSFNSIDIPGSVTYIGSSAFKGCSGLKSVTFDKLSQLDAVG